MTVYSSRGTNFSEANLFWQQHLPIIVSAATNEGKSHCRKRWLQRYSTTVNREYTLDIKGKFVSFLYGGRVGQ